jgi:hypothetical protein
VHEEALLELLSDPATTAYKIARRFDYLLKVHRVQSVSP